MGSVEVSRCSWMAMTSMLCFFQSAIICWSLFRIPRTVSKFESARIWAFYVATLRAYPMFGALRPRARSETSFRIAPLWPNFVMARLVSKHKFSVIFVSDPGLVCSAFIFVYIVVILPLLGNESSYTVFGTLGLIQLSGEWAAEFEFVHQNLIDFCYTIAWF